MQTASPQAMQPSFIPQEARDGQAVRTFSPQDQASKKPRLALAASSGTTVSPVTRRLATLTRPILGRDVLMVADKAWDGGPLRQDRHAQHGGEVLTPVQSSPKRQVECAAVPLEPSDQTVWGNIAAVYTAMTDVDGPWRMRLQKRPNGTDCALSTPACAMPADPAMPT